MAQPQFKFSTVTGFFLQDEPTTDAVTFDYSKENFGLIADSNLISTQWEKFKQRIEDLNALGGSSVQYKVLFLGRHGQGVHNVAEQRYGKAWDDYWSKLDGDEYGTWFDARLTDLGISQAETARATWKHQMGFGIPAPQSYYVSPLTRTCQTAQITFEGVGLPLTKPFRPLIKELLRETIGEHTCDKRSKASEIAAEFPEYRFEAGFDEEDLLYSPDKRETDEERNKRFAILLNDIFATDANVYLSLTAHSGAITSILEVVGHRPFPLLTGAVIPVIVQAERA
ncbi:hypothetical protein N7468_004733 [Penicillium chermesinum]|uniref:Phosphoglycerate mutase n=1 Tax=Penicillium chermesinum TaxID=63820 RepID=A0A9W9TUM4_9EURO|nr:uncharacterized protein N7468_004733 [Penicillium chermesinum]KAJ5240114.1 hypothetical protein N7468_004733 [Penicillium chermesinum]KAJ6166992.1 hypothetical protein N7470_002439 [Penicillium chermesinum]